MRGKVPVLTILSAAVLVAAVPQPARFDQRQTGTYNLHLNLQDGQVFAVVKDVLVSAPIRNFAVTLKGPIAPPTTETPRTDARTGIHSQSPIGALAPSNLKLSSDEISSNLKAPNPPETPSNIRTPNVSTPSKTTNVDIIDSNSKVNLENLKQPNAPIAAVAGERPPPPPPPPLSSNPNNTGASNNRRQNNKVASQIINHQAAKLVSPPPPPPPVQMAKPTLSPLPPLPSSIIAALTDQRTTNQRIEALPDQVNEIDRFKASYFL